MCSCLEAQENTGYSDAGLYQCLTADTSLHWNGTFEILVRKTEAKPSFIKELTSFGHSIFLSVQRTTEDLEGRFLHMASRSRFQNSVLLQSGLQFCNSKWKLTAGNTNKSIGNITLSGHVEKLSSSPPELITDKNPNSEKNI